MRYQGLLVCVCLCVYVHAHEHTDACVSQVSKIHYFWKEKYTRKEIQLKITWIYMSLQKKINKKWLKCSRQWVCCLMISGNEPNAWYCSVVESISDEIQLNECQSHIIFSLMCHREKKNNDICIITKPT